MKKKIISLLTTLVMAISLIGVMPVVSAGAIDVSYEAPSISTAPEFRINGISLKANEVYSTLKELPTEPTVGISVQMGSSYNYRFPFSFPNSETTSSAYLPNGDKFNLTVKSSTWSAFFVHGATVAYTADGRRLVNKSGTVARTIGVAQPDFNNAELVDATITGAGTYKAAIVGHDFQNDGNKPGFNWLKLTSNVGYFDGLVANQRYTVNANYLNSTIREADRLLATLKANLMYLTAMNYDLEARKLEAVIANLESDIASAETAAKNAGKTLSSDYHLEISSMKVNGYNSARSYSAGIPDMTYNVPNVVTNVNSAEDAYNFSEYDIENVYRGYSSNAIGASIKASSSGATIALPTYALEVEFTIDEGDADVFGYQGDIDKANDTLKSAIEKASEFNYKLPDVIGTVSGFKTSSVSSTAVKLTWNKVSGAQGYIVYKYDNSKKTWVRVAKTTTTANTYTVSKLASGTSYKFAVKAYKTVNGKEITSSSFPTVAATTLLPAATGFKTSSVSSSAVKLTWNKVSGAQGYIVYKYDNSKKTYVRVKKTTTNTASYTVTGLSSGTSYKFAVKPYKTVSGKEVTSSSFPTVTAITKLPTVVNGTPTVGKNSVKLTWKKTTGSAGYIVYKYDNSKKTWVRVAKTSSLNYTVKNLKSNTSYKFTVKAYKTVSGKEITSASFTSVSVKTKK